MTTLNLQVSASANDGDQNSNNGLAGTITRTEIRLGNDSNAKVAIVRFLNVAIAQGTTITSATLTITWAATYSTGNTIAVTIYGEAADNSAVLSATNNNMSGRTKTSASVASGSINNVTLNATKAWDVTTIVQEIIDRAGWSSGNALSIIFWDTTSTSGEWQDAWSYDGSTTKAAKLDITYSSGITGQAAITLGALTTSATGVLPIVGQESITLGALTSNAVGTISISGAAGITLGSLTAAGVGALSVAGQSAVMLGALSVSATGTLSISGQLDVTLDALTGAGAGALPIVGVANISLDHLVSSASGALSIAGQAAIGLNALTLAATGELAAGGSIAGQANIALGELVVAASGRLSIAGAAIITLGELIISASNAEQVGGPYFYELPRKLETAMTNNERAAILTALLVVLDE